MARYFFGREPDPTHPTIVIDNDERTVSRQHGAISSVGNGLYELTDTDSAGGTYVREKGGWRRIATAEVRAEDEIRLGMYVTTVGRLLERVSKRPAPPAAMKIERNPDTGEIVKRAK